MLTVNSFLEKEEEEEELIDQDFTPKPTYGKTIFLKHQLQLIFIHLSMSI